MSRKVGKPVNAETAEALSQSIVKRFQDTQAKGFFCIMTEDQGIRWGFIDMGHGECHDKLRAMARAVMDTTPRDLIG